MTKYNKYIRNNGMMLVLMYHEVKEDNIEIESWTVVKQSEFEKQMFYLMEYFTIISLDEAIKLVNTDKHLDKNYIVVTFDDGYSGNYDVVYPFIKKHNIPITIYVATKACNENKLYWYDEIINILQEKKDYFIDISKFNNKTYYIKSNNTGENKWVIIQELLEDLKKLKPDVRDSAAEAILLQLCDIDNSVRKYRHLTIDEINELSNSPFVTIGAHSHCHNILPNIPSDIAINSILKSKHLLEKWVSEPVTHFSYPNGDYDENIVDMVIRSGFKSSVTTRPDFWRINDSLFEIPRLGIGRYDSFEKFKYSLLQPKA